MLLVSKFMWRMCYLVLSRVHRIAINDYYVRHVDLRPSVRMEQLGSH